MNRLRTFSLRGWSAKRYTNAPRMAISIRMRWRNLARRFVAEVRQSDFYRKAREDVQIEEECGGPRAPDREIRCGYRQDVLPLRLPPEKDLDWSDQGVEGSARFLNRVWRLFFEQHLRVQNVKPFPSGTALEGDQKF